MKVLLRKYYNKAQTNENTSSHDQDSPYLPHLKTQKNSFQPRLLVNTSMKKISPSESLNDIESPKTAGHLTYGNPEKKSIETDISDLHHPPARQLTKGKSLFCPQKSINDTLPDELGQDETNEHSIYNTTTSRPSFRTDNKLHTVAFLPTQTNSQTEEEEYPIRKTQTLVLDSSGMPRKIENLLEEGCKKNLFEKL